MKKILAILVLLSIITLGIVFYNIFLLIDFNPTDDRELEPSMPRPAAPVSTHEEESSYNVYIDGQLTAGFDDYQTALDYAEEIPMAAIHKKGEADNVWDNYPAYVVFTSNEDYTEFETFPQAAAFAKEQERAFMYYRKDSSLIWSNADQVKAAFSINDVPVIMQRPELPTGCEVVSLAMLINYKGIKVDKMTLADKIKKDDTFVRKNGVVVSADPNNGYVGDMKGGFGYGVYHGPIHELLAEYFPKSALDLTGCEFEDLFQFVNRKTPVWAIINTTYDRLPESAFHKWSARDGDIYITYSEHSVLITGYDANNIYFNDPLGERTSAPIEKFKEAWIQMGSQAVTTSI